MELVAYLGTDNENWGQISALINKGEWTKIIIIKDNQSKGFIKNEKIDYVEVDSSKSLIEIKDEMMNKLKKILKGEFEVALSLASGNGKEHMALISALINLPVGIRIVVYTKNGIEYIS